MNRRDILLTLARADGQTWTADQDGSGWDDHMGEVMYGKQADAVAQMLADERERIAQEIASSVRYGAEMRHDGTEDPRMAAYIEGLKDAHDIARQEPTA